MIRHQPPIALAHQARHTVQALGCALGLLFAYGCNVPIDCLPGDPGCGGGLAVLPPRPPVFDMLVVGDFSSYGGIDTPGGMLRLRADGTFAPFLKGSGFDANARCAGLTARGRVASSGPWTVLDSQSVPNLVVLEKGGEQRKSFNPGTGFNSPSSCNVIRPDPPGGILVGGSFAEFNGTPAPRLMRVLESGAVDSNFSVGSGPNIQVHLIQPVEDGTGDLLISGDFNTYDVATANRFARISSSGALVQGLAGPDPGTTATAALPTGQGRMILAGPFSTWPGVGSVGGIVRVQSDLSSDPGFVSGTGFAPAASIVHLSAMPQGGGRFYAAGSFTAYDGTSVGRIVRIHANGTLDNTFDAGTGFDGTVDTLMLARDGTGDFFAVGAFSQYNGDDAKGIVRLRPDGSVDSAFQTPANGFVGGAPLALRCCHWVAADP